MKPSDMPTLEHRISAERLAPYRRVTAGDLGKAMALYEWNARAAAALADWICPVTRAWISERSIVQQVLADRPM